MRARRYFAALAFTCLPAAAQVVTDGTMGVGRSIQGPQFFIPANIGRVAGPNLFHSFRTFSIGLGESANFASDRGIENIIARVTGGSRSEIFGRIRSIDTTANLYLLNPAGVLFGAGASIDVLGAFHVSTADSMRFADGTVFSARVADGVTLSVAAPSAFVFRGTTAPITMTNATLAGRLGQTLAFVGGDIRIERSNAGGVVSSPSGSIGLVATAGAGEVAIGQQLTPSGFASLGRVEILAGTQVSVAESATGSTGSGRVLIRGGEIVIDRGRIDATTRRGAGGSIEIAGGNVALHGANVIGATLGAGNAPSINLTGRNIAIDGGSLVDTSCEAGCTGNGGALNVTATESFTMSGTAQAPTFLVSNSLGGGRTGHLDIAAPTVDLTGDVRVQAIGISTGASGGIGIVAGSVHLSGGAQVDASTRGAGAGGMIDVAADRVVIEGSRPDPDPSHRPQPSGFFSNTEGGGNAGSINVRAGSLQVVRGGEISSSARDFSSGQGGRISLDVAGELEIGGIDVNDSVERPRLHGVVTNTFSTGAAGEISIRAGSIRLHDYGTIQSLSEGDGPAGHIAIEGGSMVILDGSQVSSESTEGRRNSGNIDIHLTGDLRIDGGPRHLVSGLFSSANGGARGGSIRIDADTITIANTGVVTSNAEKTSIGGDISVTARRALVVGSRGGILSESTGSGDAGNITIRSEGTLVVQPNGVISTSARTSDGGDISVSAAGLAIIDHGEIKTEVGVANEGRSNGGNVVLDLPTLVMVGGRVSANAYGGNGGNIHVTAPTLILSPTSAVTASSALGIDGTIQFDSPAVDLSGALTTPPPKYLDADTILSGRCTARLAGKSSALSVVVREEIPESPMTWFLARAPGPEQCVAATGSVVR